MTSTMQADAAVLTQRFSQQVWISDRPNEHWMGRENIIIHAFDVLTALPPESYSIKTSHNAPIASFYFLQSVSHGAEIGNTRRALHGIEARTHLNLLSRLAAAQQFLAAYEENARRLGENFTKHHPALSSDSKTLDAVVSEAQDVLAAFEADFSGFMGKHGAEVTRGLIDQKKDNPFSPVIDPCALWTPGATYGVEPDILPYATADRQRSRNHIGNDRMLTAQSQIELRTRTLNEVLAQVVGDGADSAAGLPQNRLG